MSEKIYCKDCRFCENGLCHRIPPVHVSGREDSLFPAVGNFDWCYEADRRDDAEDAYYLHDEIEKMIAEKRKLQQELEKQRKEICDKTDEIQKLQNEITDMCHDVFELQADVFELQAGVKELEASNKELLDVLEAAKQFIQNGIQYGYINMPDKDCGDSALETPAKIEAAIQKARGQG